MNTRNQQADGEPSARIDKPAYEISEDGGYPVFKRCGDFTREELARLLLQMLRTAEEAGPLSFSPGEQILYHFYCHNGAGLSNLHRRFENLDGSRSLGPPDFREGMSRKENLFERGRSEGKRYLYCCTAYGSPDGDAFSLWERLAQFDKDLHAQHRSLDTVTLAEISRVCDLRIPPEAISEQICRYAGSFIGNPIWVRGFVVGLMERYWSGPQEFPRHFWRSRRGPGVGVAARVAQELARKERFLTKHATQQSKSR